MIHSAVNGSEVQYGLQTVHEHCWASAGGCCDEGRKSTEEPEEDSGLIIPSVSYPLRHDEM
jgi:hypothetical protein